MHLLNATILFSALLFTGLGISRPTVFRGFFTSYSLSAHASAVASGRVDDSLGSSEYELGSSVLRSRHFQKLPDGGYHLGWGRQVGAVAGHWQADEDGLGQVPKQVLADFFGHGGVVGAL